ncbi:purine-cytosine permease family protein [Sulfoacidibacillus thermotolerans]|uniref:Allantoin permease n=1 Tax=Sulfoacidibacillus thermotolerans TaxID=1765684 RepID=A0A2U3D171_SULT2|nr:hypothetical protein [Sulfoacidibacillus thermotolerans]PWI55040.1 hypothetical protein BM613_13490 [Sulfoacidibacillus thermotolerans]
MEIQNAEARIDERVITRKKRTFSGLVNNPVMEDYALRYAPRSFRKWSEFAVASTALGGIAYMADFAIGGSVGLSFGFLNSLYAIITVAAIIFLTGIPIAYYSAKYNIDMDLLTRGAGFGYLGSTLTSIIYASFTFIFFSLEGSVMAQAITLYFSLPIAVSYLLAVLIVIPLAMYGMTLLNRFQVWTQPIWLILMIAPFTIVLTKDPEAFSRWIHFGGATGMATAFSPLMFGSAMGVTLSLIAQIGEQADYLRFMPDKTAKNRAKWWWAVLLAGPGWVIIGAFKQLGGSFLASWIFPLVGNVKADEPIQMFTHAFGALFPASAALTIATIFVLLSQIKINVTNAYSGSLSWSNFFSRVLHFHPGRVVWLFLNVGIALGLMEFGVFGFLNMILGFYSNVAVAWVGAVVADLVINKGLLKIGPSYIEFKRAHLYRFNPVGFGSMIISSAISIAAYFDAFGATLQAFSTLLSLALPFILVPTIALATKGRYYIARENTLSLPQLPVRPTLHGITTNRITSIDVQEENITCMSCGFPYEIQDMSNCPLHSGPICSLCCSLEATCHDQCKKIP